MRAAIVVLVLAIARVAAAVPTASNPLDDDAMVIDEAGEALIESDLRSLQASGVDMAVIVTRHTIGSIEGYARDSARQWTAGKPEAAGAAVLVIAIDDRKSRIEVNDTLRPKFPDARAQAILDNARGYLRNADYTGAVRAIIGEVSAAARGIAPDMESPHPQSGLPATTSPSSTPSQPVTSSNDYDRYRSKSSNAGAYGLVFAGIAIILLIGALWAAASRKSNFTLSADGSVNTLQRPFILDWLWHSAKVVGWLGFVIFIIAAASSSSSSNTSSSWTSSSSSSFGGSSGGSSFGGGSSSSGGGGGWSGGGASSSW